VTLQKILQGLRQLPYYYIQTLFMDGIVRNISEQNIAAWLERCAELKPRGIQIYTLARPAAISGLRAVPRPVLDDIAGRVQREIHIPVSVYGA
jgi:wyosine [tRNA(Phe)-imidazoG37] synthetase (radical SAM superfamily)